MSRSLAVCVVVYHSDVHWLTKTLTSLRAAIDIAPQFGDAYFELANTLSAGGRTQEAVRGYRAALRTGNVGDVPMAHNNLGNTLADLGDLEAATREYERGLRLAPTFTYLHNGLANVFTSQSRNAEAAATLARCP
jgi:tetratricopeptide (TPR) repeat protein